MDAAHPVYLTFEGNKPGLNDQAPSKIENYALEAFKKINELMQTTSDPKTIKDLLVIADTVHQQLSAKIFEASFDVLQDAQAEYAKLQNIAAPPPPVKQTKGVEYKTVKENKLLLRKFTQSLANMLQPYGLDNKNPEIVRKEYSFNNFLVFFPRLNFTTVEREEFIKCRNEFYSWKESYLKYCQKLETLEAPILLFDSFIRDRKTGPELDNAVKEIEGSKEEIVQLGELAKQIEAEFTSFFTHFMRFVSKDYFLKNFEEAVEIFTVQKIAQTKKAPVDELKEFGGIHADYKTLLMNTRINQGTGWLNTLLEAYGAQEGAVIKVADFANWLKEAAKNPDDRIKSALERIGYTDPDKTFADFFRKNFPKKNNLQYPFKLDVALSGEMKKEFDLLNHDQGLRDWMTQVAHFSKETGWADFKTDIHRLKEQAVLIYCMNFNANREIVAQAKSMANAIIGYYLKEELSIKHQQLI